MHLLMQSGQCPTFKTRVLSCDFLIRDKIKMILYYNLFYSMAEFHLPTPGIDHTPESMRSLYSSQPNYQRKPPPPSLVTPTLISPSTQLPFPLPKQNKVIYSLFATILLKRIIHPHFFGPIKMPFSIIVERV